MKNSLLVLLTALMFLTACSNERETVSGQKFLTPKKGDGKEVSSDKYLVLNFMFKDSKDSVWYDSRKNFPQVMLKKQINKPGDKVLEVLCTLTKGDSAVFKISAQEVFTKTFRSQVPPKVDSASLFTFHFGLIDALDSAQFVKYNEGLMAKQNEKMLKEQEVQLNKDLEIIDNFLKEKNITAIKATSGLRYVITKPGTGENAKEGQVVRANYAGYLLNGKYFDTSNEALAKEKNIYQQGRPYLPLEVNIGKHGVIRGWEEMLKLMNKGSKVTVYIPSTLAWGSRRAGPEIGENSIVVFDMELVEIK